MVVSALLGPFLFWFFYSLGPLPVFLLVDATMHSLRFLVFEHFVFPGQRSRREGLVRYLVAVVPVSIGGAFLVAILAPRLDRNLVIPIGLVYAIVAGFLWARRVYRPGPIRTN